MENFISFVSENYIWFLVITIFLIFALIGYFYDTKRSKNDYINNDTIETNYINNDVVVNQNQPLNNNMNINMNNVDSNQINNNPNN